MANEKERFEILSEEVRSQLQLLAEGHQLLDQKIERIAAKHDRRMDDLETMMRLGFKEVHKRLDTLDIKIDGVEARLDARIDGVETRLDAKINEVEVHLIEKLDLHEKLHHRN